MALDMTIAFVVAAIASAVACAFVRAAGVTDNPDRLRKLHAEPRATSGGLGLALGFALGVASLLLPPVRAWSAGIGLTEIEHMAFAVASAFIFLGIGFWDDVRPMSAAPKFLVFASGAVIAPLIVGGAVDIPFGAGAVFELHPLAALIGSALWVFVLVNAVNFVDGANGLAIGAVAIGLVGLAFNALLRGAPHAAALAICGAGAAIGFLYWNFPHGKLFAGDAGALFLGALAAVASLIAIEDGGTSPFTIVLLFFPIIADVLLTLAWRVGRRRQLLDGHRDHHYQIAIRAGWSHARVTRTFWALTAGCVVLATIGSVLGRGVWLPIELRGGALEAAMTYIQFGFFVVLAAIAFVASGRIRAFAAAHGHDGP